MATNYTVEMARRIEAAHLAVPAAEPVAAHGIMGKSALLTAVGSTPRTLLQVKKGFKVHL